MNKTLKKTLGIVLSLGMIAASVVLPTAASAEAATFDASAASWKFDFGASDAVADDYIGVSADTKYTNAQGYGFIGLENGYAESWLVDGFTMTQGYDLTLENGKRDTVATADDDFVSCTYDENVGKTGMVSPIRFAMKSPENTYYKVKIKLQRADKSQEAKVNLFTERRHQHLLDTAIPEDGLTYETSVYVHNLFGKSNGNHPGDNSDTMLNIVAEGKNVAISSIEVTKQPTHGKTLFILTDSTGCEQSNSIPYWPLTPCQGIGSALAKYVSKDIAIVNEGESGLDASTANPHFNNMKDDIQEGDIVWFEFGHNDAKEDGDKVSGYTSKLGEYYTTVTQKGAYMIVVSPVNRKMTYTDGAYTGSLDEYAEAGSTFVKQQIDAGKTNIAYIDLNSSSLEFINAIDDEMAEAGYNYGYDSAQFYYHVGDYTHPNDYGADNFAYLCIKEAKDKIAAATAAESSATKSQTVQAAVFGQLLEDARNETPAKVSDTIWKAGKASAATNPYYPTSLTKVVYYDYPWLLKKVTWNDDGTAASVTAEAVECQDETIPKLYSKGKIIISDKDGHVKGTLVTSKAYDRQSVGGDLSFTDTSVVYDAAAGDTYEAYMIDDDIDTTYTQPVSNTLTERDNIDVKQYLLQGKLGNENIEDFSTYGFEVDDDIIGATSGWDKPGSGSFTYGEEGEGDTKVTFAKVASTGNSYYPEKGFSAVSSGQLYLRFDIRYTDGEFGVFYTNGQNLNDWNKNDSINPITFKKSDNELKLFLLNEDVTAVSANTWTTVTLITDLDHGTYTVSANGKSKTADFAALQTTNTEYKPAKLAKLAFRTGQSGGAVDLTNIVLATLNAPELETYKAKAVSNDDEKGTVSISGAGSTGVALGYDSTTHKASVKADKAMTVYLIEAKYTGNALSEVIPTKMEFAATGTKTQDVTAGSKLMVWKTLDGVEPVVDAIMADETVELPEVNAVTEKLNTKITITAAPSENCIFTGWSADDGATILTTENPYTFRLRDNITLKAMFATQKGVGDVANYKLKSDKSGVKAGTDQTVTVEAYDVFDDTDNPVKYSASDITWSLDSAATTAGATIRGGVVTIPAAFDMGTDMAKTITATATINNIQKTQNIVVYGYEFFEDFENGDDSISGWSNSGNISLGESEDKSNHYLIVSAGTNTGNRGSGFSFGNDVSSINSGVVKVSFDIMRSTNAGVKDRSVLQYAVLSSDSKNGGANDKSATDPVWEINKALGASETSFGACPISPTVANKSITFTANKWYHVDVYADITNNKLSYIITGGDDPIAEYNLDKTIKDISGFHILAPRGGYYACLDNLVISKVAAMPSAN